MKHLVRPLSAAALGATALCLAAGCASPAASTSPTDEPSGRTGGVSPAPAIAASGECADYALSSTGMDFSVTDESAFEALVGVDFPGPADCYIGAVETAGSKTVTTVVAVFVDDSGDIADFMNGQLPAAGWAGSAVATGSGYFSDPARGDISYEFAADPVAYGLPFSQSTALVLATVAK